ncbi:FAD-binding domain-containing protein [Infundibulicybe gibba]|nr:FAD-binding domain-containing protein [Infundibulicybe gibba]
MSSNLLSFTLFFALSALVFAAFLGNDLAPDRISNLWNYGWNYYYSLRYHTDTYADKIRPVCETLAMSLSPASAVYYPGSAEYDAGISHWVSSSTEQSACSVEPANAQDVRAILRILGAARVPFAVKGGGRTAHLGFSSTPGVHITMCRFNKLSYDASHRTVSIGSGLPWDDVYKFLQPYNVSVAGGRVSGVGVAGFLLGGGLSWKTNQVGLAIDTIEAYELVLPDGTIKHVTAHTDEDLFFALKGGMNNFGIVTTFVVRTFPQTDIWGGVITVPSSELDAVNAAIADYATEVSDPLAALNAEYIYYMGNLIVRALVFYDAPTPPAGVFDKFFAIPNAMVEVSTTDFVAFNTHGLPATGGSRVTFSVTPIKKFSIPLLQAVASETLSWGQNLAPAFVMNIVEVFLPTYFSHGAASAYPPDRSKFDQPINTYIAWDSPDHTSVVHSAAGAMDKKFREVAEIDGQDITAAACYPNIAAPDTPLENMYGRNLDRLRHIKRVYDPEDVMGLAGGYKL